MLCTQDKETPTTLSPKEVAHAHQLISYWKRVRQECINSNSRGTSPFIEKQYSTLSDRCTETIELLQKLLKFEEK